MDAIALRKQTRRTNILQVATDLFRTSTYPQVTLKKIGHKCGVDSRTIIRDFASKEAVAAALVEPKTPIHEALEQQPQEEDVVIALKEATKIAANSLEHQQETLRIVRNFADEFQTVADALYASRGKSAAILTDTINRRTGLSRRSPILAAACVTILNDSLDLWLKSDCTRSLSQLIEAGFGAFDMKPFEGPPGGGVRVEPAIPEICGETASSPTAPEPPESVAHVEQATPASPVEAPVGVEGLEGTATSPSADEQTLQVPLVPAPEAANEVVHDPIKSVTKILPQETSAQERGPAPPSAELSTPQESTSAFRIGKPVSLADVLFPSAETQERIQMWLSGMGKRHILLYGAPGSGKSSLARLLPLLHGREDAAVTYDVCNKGEAAKDVRRIVRTAVHGMWQSCADKLNYMVLDEVDRIPLGLQNDLKEAFDISRQRCILTTNHLDKIDPAIKDRCALIEWAFPGAEIVLPRLRKVVTSMGLEVSDSDLRDRVYSPSGWRETLDNLDRHAHRQNQLKPALAA